MLGLIKEIHGLIPWTYLYAAVIGSLFLWSLILRNNKAIVISGVFIFALILTRVIASYVDGDRYLFILSNDIVAIVLIMWKYNKDKYAQAVVCLYGLMALFAYLPYHLGFFSQEFQYGILDFLAYGQVLTVIGGIRNDRRVVHNRAYNAGYNYYSLLGKNTVSNRHNHNHNFKIIKKGD